MTRPIRSLTAGATLGALTLVLTACGGGHEDAAPTPAPSEPAVSSSSVSTSRLTPGATPGPSMNVLTAAKTAFTTWDQPTLDYATWWSELKPLLSAGGRQAYARTDPANIPTLKVTSAYQLDPKAPDDPDTTALVHVTTDRGRFSLFMEHEGPGKPWLLLNIDFPPGIH